jgi:acyl-CoA thioesterase YciA
MSEHPRPDEATLTLRTTAMPADTNPNGDIFGGWVMAQMDLAGGAAAIKRARGRVATVAVDGMSFHRPVFVGDQFSVYTRIARVGNSSLTVRVEAEPIQVTGGQFTFVAIDDEGRPRPVDG